jgi:hypothetical protein
MLAFADDDDHPAQANVGAIVKGIDELEDLVGVVDGDAFTVADPGRLGIVDDQLVVAIGRDADPGGG